MWLSEVVGQDAVSELEQCKLTAASRVDDTVHGILCQFSVSTRATVPARFWQSPLECLARRAERKEREKSRQADGTAGTQFISPTDGVCIRSFRADLEAHGFVMVDAVAEQREQPKQPGRFYWAVRFQFGRLSATHSISPENMLLIDRFWGSSFDELAKGAIWQLRAYKNPLAKGGYGMSINLAVRQPYVGGDGRPITRWVKDGDGKRVGDCPLPITPSSQLRLCDGIISLM